MHSIRLSASTLLATALAVAAAPVERASEPCATVSALYAESVKANDTASLQIPGQTAYECLRSMPFDSDRGSSFITEMTKYMQFHSTIDTLKNPPSTYPSQPTDLFGGLASIYEKAKANKYSGQFDFDTEINNLMASANDGHLSITLCSLDILYFRIDAPLVSISSDGLELPEIYLAHDAKLLAQGSAAVSPVVSVNGQDAVVYLEQLSLSQANQDPDARYNDVFVSPAKASIQRGGFGAFYDNNALWPGFATANLTFANSTSRVYETYAIPSQSFNYTDGKSVYESYCIPTPAATSTNESSSSTTPTATPVAAGPSTYPAPVIRDPYNLISGYYLDEEDLDDVAVLFVPTFESAGSFAGGGLPEGSEATFAMIATDFVEEAIKAGKSKLVIDVSGNPGGTVESGLDLFELFFPEKFPYTATRFRDHEAINLLGQVAAQLSDIEAVELGIPFALADAVTPDQKHGFDKWEDLYGPHYILGTNMSSLYADFNYTTQSNPETPLRGYGSVPNNETSAPFAAKDIIIIGDGFCTSTCTIFTNLMVNRGGVRTVAFGGRPINEPMQLIGGTRGSQSLEWTDIAQFVAEGLESAVDSLNSSDPYLTVDQIQRLNETAPIQLAEFPLVLGASELNFKNAYNPGDHNTPLQFVYQAADCKLFYTAENVFEPSTTWAAAARAIWGNGTCVPQSQ